MKSVEFGVDLLAAAFFVLLGAFSEGCNPVFGFLIVFLTGVASSFMSGCTVSVTFALALLKVSTPFTLSSVTAGALVAQLRVEFSNRLAIFCNLRTKTLVRERE